MAVVAVAPCQCFSPGGNQTPSPGRMTSTGPPSRWAQPQPAVTIRVWPSGWVCQAVRAPGSNVTLAPATRAGSGAAINGSMRTVPVNHSAGPLPDGCEPLRLISTRALLHLHRSGRTEARPHVCLAFLVGATRVALQRRLREGREVFSMRNLIWTTAIAAVLGVTAQPAAAQ